MIDRPGHGHSARPPRADRLGIQASLVAGALERLQPGSKALIVGHSFGGAVALRLALDHPERVSGLVLLAPVTHDWGGGGVAWYHHLAAPPVLGPVFSRLAAWVGPAQVNAGIEKVFAPNPVPEAYYEAAEIGLLFRPPNFRANARDILALRGELAEQSTRYGQLAVPVTVFSGEADTVIRPALHVARLRRQVAHIEVVSWPDVGHMPHHARTDEVASAIARLALAGAAA